MSRNALVNARVPTLKFSMEISARYFEAVNSQMDLEVIIQGFPGK